jgi:hypothetical protein
VARARRALASVTLPQAFGAAEQAIGSLAASGTGCDLSFIQLDVRKQHRTNV